MKRHLERLALTSVASCLFAAAASAGPTPQHEPQSISLRLERTLDASPAEVYALWSDPRAIAHWFLHDAAVHWLRDPIADARPGGPLQWSVADNENAQDVYEFRGIYSEAKPAERLVFSWNWRALPIEGVRDSGHTMVHVQLSARGERTLVVITQSGLSSEAARNAHLEGWQRCLNGMEAMLAQPAAAGAAADPKVDDFVRVPSGTVALTHVLVIDGTGAAPKPDQTVLLSGDKIAAIGAANTLSVPSNAKQIDLTGYTAIPGLVGMHDHLFFAGDFFHAEFGLAHDMPFSYPRLYLASGVTTIRTTGSFEPYTDLEIKKAIDSGTLLGPHLNVTGPYLEGTPFPLVQIHKLTGPDDARRMIDYWAAEGVTSFKAYADISRAELRAAIDQAHKHGLTITGHLCSIGFQEASELGIDGLEHGLFVDTEFDPTKKPDECPDRRAPSAARLDVNGGEIQATIRTLIKHHVAVTSTLPVWEEYLPPQPESSPQSPSGPDQVQLTRYRPAMRAAVWDALSEDTQHDCQMGADRDRSAAASGARAVIGQDFQEFERMLSTEMAFERAFVAAGGLLIAGPDGVLCGDIAGFGDQRELEMLVEAGFSIVDSVKIATLNGAVFLHQQSRIGSLAPGKQADIALLKGDLSKQIAGIENVELVFKDGVGYDSQKLIRSVNGLVGIR